MKIVQVACGVIVENGAVLITKRREGAELSSLWEFPGGKVHAAETPEGAMVRELREELAIDVRVEKLLEVVRHRYETHPDRELELFFFRCQRLKGEPKTLASSEMRWVQAKELSHFSFPKADEDFIKKLPTYLS